MKKYLTFVFLTVSVLGVLKILSVVPYARFSADDFAFTGMPLQEGIWKAQYIWYFGLTGRFVRDFLHSIFGIMSAGNGKVSVYLLITFSALVMTFILLFKNLIKSKISYFYPVLLSLVSIAIYYLITPDKNESWYWLAGSVTYLWPTIFGLGAIACLFNRKNTLINYIFCFLFAFLAGANEIFGLIFISILALSLTGLFFRNRSFTLQDALSKKVFFAFTGAVLSFLIMLCAPGNYVRIQGPGGVEMSILGSIAYSIQKGPQLLYSIFSQNFIYLISFFASLTFFFSTQDAGIEKTDQKEKILTRIFFILGIPILISILFAIPGYRALGRMPPSRTDVTLSFFLLLSLIIGSLNLAQLFLLLGINKTFLFKTAGYIAAFVFFLSAFKFTATFAEDIYIAKNYSGEFDKMFMELKAASIENKDQIVIVSKLPESGLIHSEPLNIDPTHWANQPISYFFGLKGIKTEDPGETSTKLKN